MENRALNAKDWPHSNTEDLNIKITALDKMTPAQLKIEWQKLYHTQPPTHIHRPLLIQALAFKLQECLFGGLSAAMKRKLKGLAEHLEDNNHQPFDPGICLKPGARLIREWHGQTFRVTVLEEGFDFNGQHYSSLSKIAQKITGTHWSGPRFFGIKRIGKRFTPNNESYREQQ